MRPRRQSDFPPALDPVLGNPVEFFQGTRGSLHIWTPQRNLLVFRATGHLDTDVASKLVAWTDRAFALGQLPHVFHDWECVTSYDSDVRATLTEYVRTNSGRIASANILVRSRLVAIGVAVANVSLGGSLRAFTSRTPFDTAIRETAQRPS